MRYGDEETPETIGALIHRVRMEQGVSQLRLAERLCASAGVTTVTRNEVSRWERGERIPTGYWLGWLAETLTVPIEALERAAAVARRHRRGRLLVPSGWVEDVTGVYVRRAS